VEGAGWNTFLGVNSGGGGRTRGVKGKLPWIKDPDILQGRVLLSMINGLRRGKNDSVQFRGSKEGGEGGSKSR